MGMLGAAKMPYPVIHRSLLALSLRERLRECHIPVGADSPTGRAGI